MAAPSLPTQGPPAHHMGRLLGGEAGRLPEALKRGPALEQATHRPWSLFQMLELEGLLGAPGMGSAIGAGQVPRLQPGAGWMRWPLRVGGETRWPRGRVAVRLSPVSRRRPRVLGQTRPPCILPSQPPRDVAGAPQSVVLQESPEPAAGGCEQVGGGW